MDYSLWNGFLRLDFFFEDREAILIFPGLPNENKNWLLKTEYFDAFPDFEIEMVKRGWHLAFIKNKNRWCMDDCDIDLKARFAKYLTDVFGLYKKCAPVGMSCGGLIGIKFTAKYPELVSALYVDAPVVNLLSCPAARGTLLHEAWDEFVSSTGMGIDELIVYRRPSDGQNASIG